ncbi:MULTISPECIES: antibiotic biosynthesis monooxygenase family protein [Chromohalobacter]|uniref:Antibiotic biosynthesis monooxygenase n=1 Tax=Chromohalobacter israelensis (strain ATCC BAA-138 / DSM 3043 / CIP 106854 / NCIMB 13768 / 1H11) TaxID=290398 RepID=Q1QUM3_CHRI1|nr:MULTISPECIES: antibiotic biosynthesis monooxygenase [Chromohalobacter]ABE59835.1 Antibiotic biosynthesis monooxygenase [Chromohalobacter salexigens DSM 3043]MBZ5877236.1 antibiotic biosynthesis monooxygenase [Chromohalobacter salexigens]MDF9435747.1 antibiotic biosynthesis monooxygenase [Chromohalobacter israelensis]MDO0947225.1 antibiotic biosynthesis monooxygenase [Chromohalobacter salexigens]NQY46570.1 antibiotic biosynthesis monooxygenase [Chromohalobacter sp.]
MPFVVINRVYVNPGYEAEFERRFQRRASQVDRQPGFRAMRVLRPQGNQAPYLVETEWDSQEAFRAWVGSDDFKQAHADPMPSEAFGEGGGLEQFEVVEGTQA